MKQKKYKIGDRIFYADPYDKEKIHSDIVIDIADKSYIADNGKEVHYQWLVLWKDGNVSSGIENYNCLSPNNPRVKELVKSYAAFDKHKDEIVSKILDILHPWQKPLQEEILKLVNIKCTNQPIPEKF